MENTAQFEIMAGDAAAIADQVKANLDNTVRPYVTSFVCFANKSAENVLEMCKVVSEAKAKLSDTLFNQFCFAVGLTPKATAISKWKKIGDRYALLSQHKQRLPSAWTTLYRLADMSDEKFLEAIANSYISTSMTAKDLNKIAPSKKRNGKKGKGKTSTLAQAQANIDALADTKSRLFTIKSQTTISEIAMQEMQDALNELCSRFGVELLAA